MAKADLIAEIQAANQAQVPEALTVKQLEELLPLAKQGDAGRAAFEAKLKEFVPTAPETKPASSVKKISVRVNEAIAAYGGEFTDPDNGQTIGKDPVSVEHTPFVRQLLRTDELVEAD